jgi:hypothetical protein
MALLGGIAQSNEERAFGEAQEAAYKQQGAAALAVAKNQAAQEKDKYRRLAASQRANLGASGIDVNQGSALDVLADTDAEGAVSAMQLLYSGELENWNARQRAAMIRAQSESRANSALLGGIMSGLTGMAETASKFSSTQPSAGNVTSSGANNYTPYLTQYGRGNNSPVR